MKDPNRVAYLRSTFADSPAGAVIRVCPSSSTTGGVSFLPLEWDESPQVANRTRRSVEILFKTNLPPCQSLLARSPIWDSSASVTSLWYLRRGTPVGKICWRWGPRGKSSSSTNSSSRVAASSNDRSSGPCTAVFFPPPFPVSPATAQKPVRGLLVISIAWPRLRTSGISENVR